MLIFHWFGWQGNKTEMLYNKYPASWTGFIFNGEWSLGLSLRWTLVPFCG